MHGQCFWFCSALVVIPGLSFMATRRVADLYYRCFEETALQMTMVTDNPFQRVFSFVLGVPKKVLPFEKSPKFGYQAFSKIFSLTHFFNGPKISGDDKIFFSVFKEYEITHRITSF